MYHFAYAIKLDSINWLKTNGHPTFEFHQAGIILDKEYALELFQGVKCKYPLAQLLVV
jgi:hypothetical protein